MRWFKNFKIGSKLIIGFSIMILFMGTIGFMGYNSTKIIGHHLDNIFTIRLPSIDSLIEADRDLQQLLVSERSMIFANAKSDLFKGLVNEYEEKLRKSDERWQKYKALPHTSEENTIIPLYEKAREKWKVISRRIVDGRVADTRQGRREALDLTLGLAKDKFEQMRNHIDQLTDINLEIAKQAHHAANDTYGRTKLILLGITGLGLFVGIFFAWAIAAVITKPVKEAVAGLQDIAEGEGDLTRRLDTDSEDEVGSLAKWFNAFIDKLHSIMIDVTTGADALNASSKELSLHSGKMSKNADSVSGKSKTVTSSAEGMSSNINSVAATMEQAATNIDMVATSVEEMTITVNEIAQRAEKARTVVDDAVSQAKSA